MFTLGFPFHPWKAAKAIADGPSILEYLHETASTYGIDKHIRFGERVVRASWSSEDAQWTVETSQGVVHLLVLVCVQRVLRLRLGLCGRLPGAE